VSEPLPPFVLVGRALATIRDRRLYKGPLSPEDAALRAECEAVIHANIGKSTRTKRSGIKRSDPRPHDVYVHLAADGTVLYVGVSLSTAARTAAHRASDWWQQVASIRVEHLPTRDAALTREAELIASLKPLYNKDPGR
jgi:hypothetical protein